METLATMNTVPKSGTPDTTPPPVGAGMPPDASERIADMRVSALLAKVINERASFVRNYQAERQRIEDHYNQERARITAEYEAAKEQRQREHEERTAKLRKDARRTFAIFVVSMVACVALTVFSALHK